MDLMAGREMAELSFDDDREPAYVDLALDDDELLAPTPDMKRTAP